MDRLIIWPSAALLSKFISRWAIGTESDPKSLLCLSYLTDINASSRQRVYNYIPYFEKYNIRTTVAPPTAVETYQKLFLPWQIRDQLKYFIILFLKRFSHIFSASNYDVVLFQRELFSEFFYDPPFWVFPLRLLSRRLVFDVDDVLWKLPPQSVRAKSPWQNRLARMRFRWNVGLSDQVVVSTEHIAEYARRINSSLTVISTPVDARSHPARKHTKSEPVVIGWTGGPGNLAYLKMVEKSLEHLASRYALRFHLICSKSIALKGIEVSFIPWHKNTEPVELAKMDIGIMPLSDNEYTRGKAGFKILEYMAAGLPSVASPVGVNAGIIDDGVTGFLARDEKQWIDALSHLIESASLRMKMGSKSREVALEKYDYSVWSEPFKNTVMG
jgi:glycosyltransferase involved in cell wall biosynthesis